MEGYEGDRLNRPVPLVAVSWYRRREMTIRHDRQYESLASEIFRLAMDESNINITGDDPLAILPETLNARDRLRLETARRWLTRPSARLALWCQWLAVDPAVVIERSQKLLAGRLRHEYQRRASASCL